MVLALDSIDLVCNIGPIESLALVQKLGIIDSLIGYFDLPEAARDNVEYHPQ